MAENKDVLIIGGGITGLTAAVALSRAGADILLIEKAPFIGGHAAGLSCKATDRCLKCNRCLLEAGLREASGEKGLLIKTGTLAPRIEQLGGRFRVTLHTAPRFIDPARCTDCGLCFERCREAGSGAILRAPSSHIHPFFAIDSGRCTDCPMIEEAPCRAVCPEGAINLDKEAQRHDFEVDGLLLATGYEPFDPERIKSLHFGRFKNMITEMDLDRMLILEGDVYRPSDGTRPERIAFIQCVGSRNPRLGQDYCSRVCCGYALRTALKLAHESPEVRITLFYMDIQNFGKDFERYFQEAKDKVALRRGLPGDFNAAGNDCIALSYYDGTAGKRIFEEFDMVILSVGMIPPATDGIFREMLGLPVNDDGFFMLPEEMSNRGIFVAGSASGPMDISESISDAKGTALEMAKYLGLLPRLHRGMQ